ncbi:hypothetical protein [Calderihabitans maritimus]|uniref:Uncharacterized protein n=1 Tax=Calderihabitans maritimus TaxID=1246530 RepID=A0A1Z5HNB0_9FIRM|nr:hypothetical protein [Calderihabitans maritimus]GAW91009.1 hypothetical protein TherJR_1624 [Calderihabitans maritimus]
MRERPLKLKIRLDYQGQTKPSGFFFRGNKLEKAAEEVREQKITMLRNVPLPGLTVEDIDASGNVYTVTDEISGAETAYAPVILTISADSIADVIRFVMRDEFRQVEILEPGEMVLKREEVERILFQIREELQSYRLLMERKMNGR